MPQRLLQIIHASDPHFVGDSSAVQALAGSAAQARWKLTTWPVIGKKIAAYLARGTLGHDAYAWPAFMGSVTDVVDGEPEWKDLTWLCITGDLSTWGDEESLQAARNRIEDLATRLGIAAVVLYGNHDVWSGVPSLLPIQTPERVLARQHRDIRNGVLGTVPPFAVELAAAGSPVQICALNTVVHEPVFNTLAMGWVGAENEEELATIRTAHDSRSRVLVVLTHHPVHDPAQTVACENGLQNGHAVAEALGVTGLPCVVLSGHTHSMFPAFAALPFDVSMARHEPLHGHQAQLTVGTMSQRKSSHTWQLLRFWGEDDGTIQLERIVFERTSGQGEFEPRCGSDPSQIAESMQLA